MELAEPGLEVGERGAVVVGGEEVDGFAAGGVVVGAAGGVELLKPGEALRGGGGGGEGEAEGVRVLGAEGEEGGVEEGGGVGRGDGGAADGGGLVGFVEGKEVERVGWGVGAGGEEGGYLGDEGLGGGGVGGEAVEHRREGEGGGHAGDRVDVIVVVPGQVGGGTG